MQVNEQSKKNNSPRADIDFAKGVSLDGITEIISSTDKTFVARAGENVLTVQGEGLNPKLIDVEKQTAVLGGKIHAVSQSSKMSAKGFFAKLFK